MTALIVSLLPPFLIVAGVMLYARARSCDNLTLLTLFIALGLYYFHFYHSSWTQYAVDTQPHMDYITFLLRERRLPLEEDYLGAAARHPPAFYIVSAAFLGFANITGVADPAQFTRHVAMASYVLFIMIGVQLLRQLLLENKGAYFSALLLLLFWPIGVVMGGRISCDILLYATEMGALCALIEWNKDKTPQQLCAPFIWGGVSAMSKNSGVAMIAFAGLALLMTAYKNRKNLRALLRIDLIASILFALANLHVSTHHGWVGRNIETFGYNWNYFWHLTNSFNLFVFIYDTALGLSEESFWNMWLHTLLLGDATMRWKYPDILILFKILWLVMVVYDVDGLVKARKQVLPIEKGALQWLAVFTIAMIVAALYLLLRSSNPNYADARYAYPAVSAFVLAHGLAVKYHFQAGRVRLYKMGVLFSIMFTALTFVLFGTQHLL